jgi:hypothetical protein
VRDYILEQIKLEQRGQLNEIDPKSVLNKIRNFGSSEQSINNKKIASILSQTFEGEFAKYLYKKLIEAGKSNVDILKTLTDYQKNPNSTDYQNVFRLIGIPMLSYFVDKTFGEASIGGKIRQYTPLMSKVSTGNSELDRHVFEALGEVVRNGKVREMLQTNLEKVLKGKLQDLSNSKEYQDLISSVLPNAKTAQPQSSGVSRKSNDNILNVFDNVESQMNDEKSIGQFKQYKETYSNWVKKSFVPKYREIISFLQSQANKNESYDIYDKLLNEVTAKDFIAPEIKELVKIIDDGEENLDKFFDSLNLDSNIGNQISKMFVDSMEKLNTIDKQNIHKMLITLLDVGDVLGVKKLMNNQMSEGYFSDKYDEFKGRHLKGSIERNKWKILDGILDNLPNLRTEIKREVKTAVFGMDYQDIENIIDGRSVSRVAEIVTLPILKYVVKNSRGLYLKDEAFKSMSNVLEKIFTDESVVNHVKGNVEIFIKLTMKKLREQEALKANKNKRKRKRK